MTTYTVHLFREMRLSYCGIEAATPEEAAEITRDKPTGEADDIEDCDGETLSALVDQAGDDEYEHSRLIDFEAERQRKTAASLLASLQAVLPYAHVECRSLHECWRRDADEAARREAGKCDEAVQRAYTVIAEATSSSMTPGGMRPYSVLLLYPDYANDGGTETYYALVEAADPLAAIAEAKRRAVAAQEGIEIDPDDFAPLLVSAGHHYGEPMFDK